MSSGRATDDAFQNMVDCIRESYSSQWQCLQTNILAKATAMLIRRSPQHSMQDVEKQQLSSTSFTVKLHSNRLAYNVSLVIEYPSSRSRHFSIQNMSVSTYLDITYPWLLRTDSWAQILQQTPASTYVRPPSRRLCSWLQPITCRQSATLWCHRHVAQCQIGGCWLLLIAVNAGHSGGSRKTAPTSLHSSYAQSRKQSAALITLFDLNDGIRCDTFVCATSRNLWPFDTLAFFPSLLVITYLAYNVPIFLIPRNTLWQSFTVLRTENLFSMQKNVRHRLHDANPLQPFHVLHKEPISVVPRQKYVFNDVTNSFLLEAEIVCTHHRWIHQIQSATYAATI